MAAISARYPALLLINQLRSNIRKGMLGPVDYLRYLGG
jgi:hypothetical protein